jgi:hypothetical protein
MELQSFKEILLKKTVGNKAMMEFVQYIGDEFLIEQVAEALEKMARPTHNMGAKISGPIATYAANLDRSDIMQLRDALSHHVSHYKAALKAHHASPEGPEKRKLRDVADRHLSHLLPLMHLAARAGAHSNGKLSIDYPKLAAWETNYTTLDRNPNGRFVHDAKLLRRRPAAGARQWSEDNTEARGVKDYHYLERPPHPGHDDYANMPHEGGYPWEEVQVGAPTDIDSKKAYLHIEDVPDKKAYEPHPFDNHPVRAVEDIQADHFSQERLDQFADQLAGWKSSEHHKKWMEGQRAAHQRDPEGYKARGTVKAPHVYEGIPLQEHLGHVHNHPKKMKRVPGAAPQTAPTAPSPSPVAPTSGAVGPKAVAPVVRKPVTPGSPAATPTATPPAAPSAPHPMEEAYKHYMKAPDSLKQIFHGNKEFMAYLATKNGK